MLLIDVNKACVAGGRGACAGSGSLRGQGAFHLQLVGSTPVTNSYHLPGDLCGRSGWSVLWSPWTGVQHHRHGGSAPSRLGLKVGASRRNRRCCRALPAAPASRRLGHRRSRIKLSRTRQSEEKSQLEEGWVRETAAEEGSRSSRCSPLQRLVTAQHRPPQLQPALLFRHSTQAAPRRPAVRPGHSPAGGETCPTAESIPSTIRHSSPEPPRCTQEATTKADGTLNVLADGMQGDQKTRRPHAFVSQSAPKILLC